MIRGVICDLDGTVYLSGRPLPGVPEALAELHEAGIAVTFVSNNPTVASSTYARRLSGMGIPATTDDVITSGGVTAAWLQVHHPDDSVLLVSEPSLRAEFLAARLTVTEDPTRAHVVVVSFDRTFDYAKWQAAFDALRLGAHFVATNPDATCPVADGELPDCAGIIAALEATTGRALDTVIGKPSPIILDAALNRLCSQLGVDRLRADEVVVVGDRIETDVRMGSEAGLPTALVLTGVSSRECVPVSELSPTWVLGSLAELPQIVLAPSTAPVEVWP